VQKKIAMDNACHVEGLASHLRERGAPVDVRLRNARGTADVGDLVGRVS